MIRILTIAIVLLLAGCGPQIPTSAQKPMLTGWVLAQGKSMLPTFPEAAFVEIEIGSRFEDLKVGDTVIFWDYTRGAGMTHHRLVAKQGDAFIAQGDNKETNAVVDKPWVTRDNFVARGTGRWAILLVPPYAMPPPAAPQPPKDKRA